MIEVNCHNLFYLGFQQSPNFLNTLTHLHRGRTPINAPTTMATLSPVRNTAYRMQNYFINLRINGLAFVPVTYLSFSLQWPYTVTSFSGFYTPDNYPTFKL